MSLLKFLVLKIATIQINRPKNAGYVNDTSQRYSVKTGNYSALFNPPNNIRYVADSFQRYNVNSCNYIKKRFDRQKHIIIMLLLKVTILTHLNIQRRDFDF